jgi:hypothetical protein
MKNSFLFTEEEINRINLAKFINKLFSRYKELHIINIFLYSSSLVQKGKTVCIKPKLKIATTFKYESFYCFWFDGGAKAYQNEEELKNYLTQDSILKILNNYSPVNFYLREEDKRITYNDFESSILNKKEFEDKRVESIFGEKNKISFCRENMSSDIETFLGSELVAKQKAKKNASLLAKKLPQKEGKRSYIKI